MTVLQEEAKCCKLSCYVDMFPSTVNMKQQLTDLSHGYSDSEQTMPTTTLSIAALLAPSTVHSGALQLLASMLLPLAPGYTSEVNSTGASGGWPVEGDRGINYN